VKIFLGSPRLEQLGLSITNQAISRLYSDYRFDDYADFFDRICHGYELAGGNRLPLRRLKCGGTAYPLAPGAILKLAQLDSLEEAHIENCGVYYDESARWSFGTADTYEEKDFRSSA
jgi:hypothetical protein